MTKDQILKHYQDFIQELAAAKSIAALEELKVKFLGKKSFLKNSFKDLKDLPQDQKVSLAKDLNETSQKVEQDLERAKNQIAQDEYAKKFEQEWVDPSFPGLFTKSGSLHPVTEVENKCMEILRQLGFSSADGPEVESPHYNFDALNIPPHHPARDMQDTFWVSGGLLLRSHTTTVQARILEKKPKLPIKIASAGRVYRNEAVDATHLAMFHQLEGFWLDKGINFSHLKGVLLFVARGLYGQERKFRFKPKFYPYTEPSIGLDIACTKCSGDGCEACHQAGWLTIMGAGMIHQKILQSAGFDPKEVGGIAFGWGTTRVTSQWLGLHRVKSLYEPDLRLFSTMERV